MKKNLLPAPSVLGRACAGFSLAGFWRENRSPLLMALAAAAAVIVLLFWLARRRRQDAFPEINSPPPRRLRERARPGHDAGRRPSGGR